MIKHLVSIGIVAWLLVLPAVASAEEGATALMRNVLDRYDGDTRISILSLVTCSYRVADGKITCASSPRQKKMQQVVKDYGANMKDTRGVTIIVEPNAENGIGILQYDYEQRGRDTDQWLYLPELGQVKRVASAADAPKKGSLFGSEFSLEDIETPKIEDYDFATVEETTSDGRPVSVIQQIPTRSRAPKSNYSKQVHWIDTERLVILKTDYYGWNGDLMKSSTSADIEKISDIWTVKKLVMRNLETKRISVMSFDQVYYNDPVSDEILTKRMLSDALFRESKLRLLGLTSAG